MKHRQTIGLFKERLNLNHRVTSRLYPFREGRAGLGSFTVRRSQNRM
jgi:hypothetical protein